MQQHQRALTFIDSLNAREAKMLNTYVNQMNTKNEEYKNKHLYDDDTYKHDEHEIDYKVVLKTKLDYIPENYQEFVERYRTQTEYVNLETRYHNACRTIYYLSHVLQQPDKHDLIGEMSAYVWDFMKYTDDFMHFDEFEEEFDENDDEDDCSQ